MVRRKGEGTGPEGKAEVRHGEGGTQEGGGQRAGGERETEMGRGKVRGKNGQVEGRTGKRLEGDKRWRRREREGETRRGRGGDHRPWRGTHGWRASCWARWGRLEKGGDRQRAGKNWGSCWLKPHLCVLRPPSPPALASIPTSLRAPYPPTAQGGCCQIILGPNLPLDPHCPYRETSRTP